MPNRPTSRPPRCRPLLPLSAILFLPALLPAATLTTTPGPSVTLGSGVSLTDSALLSGGNNPGGIMTFLLSDPNNNTVDTELVSVTGNGTYSTPTGFLPLSFGTYQWEVIYNGDSNNSPVISPLGSEPESVTPAAPTISTTPGPTVVLGTFSSMTDTATLSGGFNPTGVITFLLVDPGNGVVDTESVSVHGNGTYTTPTGFLPFAPGTYQWQALYSGDPNNMSFASLLGIELETATTALPEPSSRAFMSLAAFLGLCLWARRRESR